MSSTRLWTRDGAVGVKNCHQHAAFVAEVQAQPARHREVIDWIDWFLALPLWPELPGLRVWHACWHPAIMARLRPGFTPAAWTNAQARVARW